MVVTQDREKQICFVSYSYNITREFHHPLANQKKLLPRNLCAEVEMFQYTKQGVLCVLRPACIASLFSLSLSKPNSPSKPCQVDTTISIWSTCCSPRKTGIMFWLIAESQYPVSWVMIFATFTLLPGSSTCNCKLDF